METNKKEMPKGIPAFLMKMIQDKKDIKEALKNKKSLAKLAKEKDITFAQPL
jgi:hypothetical protein